MKKNIKRTLAILLALGFAFNSHLLSEIKEVKADWIHKDVYESAISGAYTGGLPNIFQVYEWESDSSHSPYVYFTRGKTTSSKTNHNVHRTIALQISRIKDGVNPFDEPYYSYKKQGNPLDSDDPHYYKEVSKSDTHYDESHEAITVNGKTYSREYFTIPLDSAKASEIGITSTTDEIGGYTINSWFIPYDTLWNQIQYSYGVDGWYEELKAKEEAGEPYYFGVDAVKTWVHLGSNANSTSDDTIHAKYTIVSIDSDHKTYWIDYWNDDGNPVVWTWANWQTDVSKSKSGLSSSMLTDYYNKYYRSLVLTAPVETPETQPTKTAGTFNLVKNETDDNKNVTNTGNTSGSNTTVEQSQNAYASPGIFTYNDSDKYELGTAIPTSNTYTNGVVLDGWYGNVQLTETTYTRTERTTNYAINYTWEKWVTSSEKNEDGDIVDTSHYETQYGTEYATSSDPVYSTWQGTYTTITDVDLYQLQSTTTTNDAGGTITYTDNVLTHVPYSITINGTTYTSGSAQDGSDDALVPSFAASDSYHVKENAVDTSRITVNVGSMGTSKPSHDAVISAAKEQVQYIWNSRVKNNASLVTLQNDEFTIDGITYLTNPSTMTQNSNGVWLKGGNINWTYEKDKTHEMCEATTNNIKEDIGTASIPSSVINGYYYTNISATYKSFISSKNQTVTMAIKDNLGDNTSGTVHDELNNSAKPAIIRTGSRAYTYAKSNYDYTINEPVVVHTPVIAPIHISDGETQTQLADNTGMSLSQLILDHEYTIEFDWESYFTDLNHYKGYEAPAGWTQYIKEKKVAFPFSVEVNGVYYDIDSEDGYTPWISVGSTTTSFTFYLPSWSQEGLYYDPSGSVYSTWNSFGRPIKVRVEAENMGGFEDSEQVEYNGDKGNYVATFTYPCQVSGIIYDFQVVSVRDYKNFATSDWVDEAGMSIFNFVTESGKTNKLQAEKNVGQNNRLGLPYMRYTLDGDMTDSWSYENTLPFASGKSVYGTESGYLVRGNTIAFTIKTIANLTGEDDYIKLTPNYRYYASDGTLYDTDEIDIYYMQGSTLIKMGSTADYDRMKPNSLYMDGGSIWYHDSYFDYFYDTFKSTAEHKAELWRDSDITENYVKLGTMEESYCVGEIKLDQSLCLWTGNEEELAVNIESVNNVNTALRYIDELSGINTTFDAITDLQYASGYNYYNKDSSYGYGEYDDIWSFESSMQTWYGKYAIPSNLYVCPKGALEEYLENEVDYIDFTEDFWLPDDGTLVLNFDISSYMDGHEHLQYYGPSGSSYDMWSTEHGDTSDPTYRPGDVGKIELKYESVADHFNIGTLYIN